MTLSEIFAAIGLLYTIEKQAEQIISDMQKNKDDQWFKDSAKVRTELESAQTEEELRNASKNLASLISRL